jgi:hypothetical protein
MNQKYASYFNIGINSALSGSGLILLTLSLINGATHLLPTYGTNGLKATVAKKVCGYERK